METCFSQPVIFIVLLKKEKKNNPKLAVNIMQEIMKETTCMHQECFTAMLSSCFSRLANSVIFPAEFCVFVLHLIFKYKRDSLINFRAQRARENLRKKKGAEEIRRAFEKMEGHWGKKGMVPFCFGM